MLADQRQWRALPTPSAIGSSIQAERSVIPGRDEVLVETFPRGSRHFLVAYPFEGRLAHQTLGMLLTRRLDRLGASPSASSPTTTRWRCGASATWRRWSRAGRLDLASCSPRTCWATTSTPGSPNRA